MNFIILKLTEGPKLISCLLLYIFLNAAWSFQSSAQTSPSSNTAENEYYKITTIPVPSDIILEVGGLVVMPDGKVAVSTRRGEVWIIDVSDVNKPVFKRFARGLHEALGLKYKDNAFYLAQRGELTKLTDEDGDGRADFYETVASWPLSGNYHEYSFGPVIKSDGSMYITGNVGFIGEEWWRGKSLVPWRGWTQKIMPDGKATPFATGMRSPCGLGLSADGELFYSDNQGDWMGSGFITHVEEGDFTGHPAGLNWASRPESPVKLSAKDIYAKVDPRFAKPGSTLIKPENNSEEKGTALFEVAKDLPAIKIPAVWLPHTVLGVSTSDILAYKGKGSFGPFEGQVFVGDQGQSKIVRVFLEKIKGEYQGVAFPFREGFSSGVLRMDWADNGMFVGMTNRGWGSTGNQPYGLQKLEWTGKVPFEIKTVKAQPDGFELEFTEPVDKASAGMPSAYEITGFIYKYHPVYGSPVVNDENCAVKGVIVSEDGLKARLVVDNLRLKYVHEIKVANVTSANKLPLLHPVAYYTLNNVPDGEKIDLTHLGHGKMEMGKSLTTATNGESKSGKRVTVMPSSWKKPDQEIKLGTKPGLKYDLTEVTVKAGSKIKLTFGNNDDMPHNCTIVMPGTAIEVGDLAIKLGLKGTQMSYIPNTEKLLYHTNLIAPGSSETIYFTAPSAPGIYTIVCTVPGHAYVMQSTFKVN